MSVMETWHPSMGTRPVPGGERGGAEPTASRAGWALASAALVVLALVALWVTHSAVFEVRNLTVGGNRHLTRAHVLRAAGVDEHTNVLWLSTGKVERRLVADPWIRSAHVSRTLPTSLSISITERDPVAAVRSGEVLYLVSGDGMVLGRIPSAGGVPVIDVRGAIARVGSRLGAATGALEAITALPESVRARVHGAVGDRDDGLVIELSGGVRAIYGDGSAASAKAQALTAVLAWARRHGVALAYVDVRAPVTPAARPVVPAEATPAQPLAAHPVAPAPTPGATPSGR